MAIYKSANLQNEANPLYQYLQNSHSQKIKYYHIQQDKTTINVILAIAEKQLIIFTTGSQLLNLS